MKEELKEIYIPTNDTFGLPQKYKNIDLYPIKIKDGRYLALFNELLTYPKNVLANTKEIIGMSYLKFIALSNHENIIDKINNLMSYITKKEAKLMYQILNPSLPNSPENMSMSIFFDEQDEITESEFEDLREIILEQNGTSIEYVNQYHPELEEKLELIHKKSDLTFEDEVFTICVLMHKNPEELGEYTIIQMQNIFDRLLTLKQFDVYEPLAVSGAIKLQSGGKVKPFLYHKSKKGRYDDILISSDSFFTKNKEILGDPSR